MNEKAESIIAFVTNLTRVVRNTDLDDPIQFAAFRQVTEERLAQLIQQYADEQSKEFVEWLESDDAKDLIHDLNIVEGAPTTNTLLSYFHQSQKP